MTDLYRLSYADRIYNRAANAGHTVRVNCADIAAEADAEIKRLRAALAESCAEERSQMFEAGPGGGCSRAIQAESEVERLRAAAEQARAALQMTTMLKRLGGMLPGTHEMVQLTVEEAEGALRALDEALKCQPSPGTM